MISLHSDTPSSQSFWLGSHLKIKILQIDRSNNKDLSSDLCRRINWPVSFSSLNSKHPSHHTQVPQTSYKCPRQGRSWDLVDTRTPSRGKSRIPCVRTIWTSCTTKGGGSCPRLGTRWILRKYDIAWQLNIVWKIHKYWFIYYNLFDYIKYHKEHNFFTCIGERGKYHRLKWYTLRYTFCYRQKITMPIW